MYSANQDMDANVGLFDSLASAEWTAKYIHKFGGLCLCLEHLKLWIGIKLQEQP